MKKSFSTYWAEDLQVFSELLTSIGREPLDLKRDLEEWRNREAPTPNLASRIYVDAIFAIKDFSNIVLEDQNVLPILLTSCDFVREMRNLKSLMDIAQRWIPKLKEGHKSDEGAETVLFHVFFGMFKVLGTFLVKYKELLLKVKEIDMPKILPERTKRLWVTSVPEEVRASLGVKDSPTLYRELLRVVNNTAIIVASPEAVSEWRELKWVKVRDSNITIAELLKSRARPTFYTIEDIPHVFIVSALHKGFIPNLLVGSHFSDYFNETTMVEFLLYFKPNEWVKFTKEVIMSAARRAVRR